MWSGRREPTAGQVVIVLRQENKPVTLATLGSLMDAWDRLDHLSEMLSVLVVAGRVREVGGGWVAT